MKRCPNCNKEFINGNYCTTCGIPLVEDKVEFDIFGDPIYESHKEPEIQVLDANNNVIVADTDNLIERNEGKDNFKTFSKFISLVSIGTLFMPFYGSVISIVALIFNLVVIKNTNNKKHITYFAIALVTLILSIVFLGLLIKTGVLQEVTESVLNE